MASIALTSDDNKEELDTWIYDLMPRISHANDDKPKDKYERRTYYSDYSSYINRPNNAMKRDDLFHRRQASRFKYLFPNTEEERYKDKDAFYPYLHGEMEDITVEGDRGVQKVVTKAGAGGMVDINSFVTIHFSAYYYANGKEAMFDSTWERRRPYRFHLNADAVVSGLNMAVSTMREGEISRFLFKPDYFFPNGLPEKVPSGANVMFVVKLVKFQGPSYCDEFYTMTAVERFRAPFSTVIGVAEQEHLEGQEHIAKNRWREALHCYTRMAFMMKNNKYKSANEGSYSEWVRTMDWNVAKCCFKLGYLKMADTITTELLSKDSIDVDCRILKGKIYIHQRKYERAINYLETALVLSPGNEEIENLLKDVKNKQDELYGRKK